MSEASSASTPVEPDRAAAANARAAAAEISAASGTKPGAGRPAANEPALGTRKSSSTGNGTTGHFGPTTAGGGNAECGEMRFGSTKHFLVAADPRPSAGSPISTKHFLVDADLRSSAGFPVSTKDVLVDVQPRSSTGCPRPGSAEQRAASADAGPEPRLTSETLPTGAAVEGPDPDSRREVTPTSNTDSRRALAVVQRVASVDAGPEPRLTSATRQTGTTVEGSGPDSRREATKSSDTDSRRALAQDDLDASPGLRLTSGAHPPGETTGGLDPDSRRDTPSAGTDSRRASPPVSRPDFTTPTHVGHTHRTTWTPAQGPDSRREPTHLALPPAASTPTHVGIRPPPGPTHVGRPCRSHDRTSPTPPPTTSERASPGNQHVACRRRWPSSHSLTSAKHALSTDTTAPPRIARKRGKACWRCWPSSHALATDGCTIRHRILHDGRARHRSKQL